MARGIALTIMLLGVTAASDAGAYDFPAHRQLGEAAAAASQLDLILTTELGFKEGTATPFGLTGITALSLVGAGAADEDGAFPYLRVLKHFHNPSGGDWARAGLSLDPGGQSSILWQQNDNQDVAPQFGGTWSWQRARREFLAALTRPLPDGDPDARTRHFGDTLLALGHLTHVIQDATVPAHVRDDAHLSLDLGLLKVGVGDGYESWVDRRAARIPELAAVPVKPQGQRFIATGRPQAPAPVARLLDTDALSSGSPLTLLAGTTIGIAEYSHGNFLSDDTIFVGSPLPALESRGSEFTEVVAGETRRYFPKVTDGQAIRHFHRAGVSTKPLTFLGSALTGFVLDETVYADYAALLLPRAVGYSAALIDYFFRGRLDVGLADDAGVPRMVGSNASDEPLGPGSLFVYAEDAAGVRGLVSSAAGVALSGPIQPGQPLPDVPLTTVPVGTDRFVAVYQGGLGDERPAAGSPGAVIGRVFNAVRVEEIFRGAGRWQVRSPQGVFALPLTTDQYREVKWGDGPGQLVARTPLGAGAANRLDAFDVERLPGSPDFATDSDGITLKLTPRASGSLQFASPPVVSTVQFSQTIRYRQRIGRVDPHKTTFTWHPGPPDNPALGFCEQRVESAAVQFETVQSLAPTFREAIPLVLDVAHNPDLGGGFDPYYWQLMDFGIDRSGRLVGLVVVLLDRPSSPGVSAPIVGLDSSGGIVTTPYLVEPYFPFEVTPAAWALVDVGQGTVIAATTDPTLAIASEAAQESVPAIYAHLVVENDGCADFPSSGDVWSPLQLVAPADAGHPIETRTPVDVTTGDLSLAISGYMRSELAQALAPRSLLSFETTDVFAGSPGGDAVYACGESTCNAITLTQRLFLAQRPALKLWSGVRTRPAPAAGERVVFLGDADTPRFRSEGHLVVWDPGTSASVRLSLRESAHSLSSTVTSSLATVFFSDDDTFLDARAGSYLVPLDGGAPIYFDQENLGRGFALLDPGYLYGTDNLKFYRLQPPLQPSVLPAALAPVAGNPRGDYHTVRLR
jgi:hypothetical protein